MKNSSLPLSLLMILSCSSYLYPITLDQALINKKALEIEKKITQDRYIKYGLTTMAITYGICQFMPVVTSIIPKPTSIITKSVIQDQNIDENRSIGQTLKSGLKIFTAATGNVLYNLFGTQESWLFIAQCIVGGLGANIITEISQKYIHPDTLRWYIHSYAPYYSTIKLMKERILELQDPLLANEQREISNKMLLLLHKRLVRQAHCISAYVAYKVKYLDPAEKTIGKQVKQSMIKTHTQWLTCIEEQLNTSECDLTILEKMIDSYSEIVTVQINHFALAEGETKKERAFVRKNNKSL